MSFPPALRHSSILGSTVISALLHIAMLGAVVYSVDSVMSPGAVRGAHVEIDLVRATASVQPGERQDNADRPPQANDRAADVPDTAVNAAAEHTQPGRKEETARAPAAADAAASSDPPVRKTGTGRSLQPSGAQPQQAAAEQAKRLRPASDTSDNRVALIARLLHEAISAHKRYPYLAKRRGLSGTSKVRFMLAPDGRVSATRVIRSSSHRSLDRAAMTAVNSIDPFTRASDYLERPEQFEINVVFSLR